MPPEAPPDLLIKVSANKEERLVVLEFSQPVTNLTLPPYYANNIVQLISSALADIAQQETLLH